MTPREIECFNAGVAAVLDLARAAADALGPKLKAQPTRINFAIGALEGIADEGGALLLPSARGAGATVAQEFTLPKIAYVPPINPVEIHVGDSIAAAPPAVTLAGAFRPAQRRIEARAQGYLGEACSECGNFTLKRNGTCLTCETCGRASGCS